MFTINIKYYIVNIFALLLFLFANQTVFAIEYDQEYRNGISKTGIYAENLILFGVEIGHNEIENRAGLKSEFGQECENVGKVFIIATRGISTIYRAVSKAEFDDIAKFGLINKAGAYETGKLFAPTAREAVQFGKNNFMFDGLPNTIIS